MKSCPTCGRGWADKKPRAGTAYPVEFEAGWAATSRTGPKYDAWMAWEKAGSPDGETVAAAWAAWSKLPSWRGGFVPHVRKWLRGRCFEQMDPREAASENAPPGASYAAKRVNLHSVPAPSPYCTWHQKPGTRNHISRFPLPGCPECKHVAAMGGHREGEPEATADLFGAMPEWASK